MEIRIKNFKIEQVDHEKSEKEDIRIGPNSVMTPTDFEKKRCLLKLS